MNQTKYKDTSPRKFCSLVHRKVITETFRDKLFSSLIKELPEAKAIICSTMKENLLLYCRGFLTFANAVHMNQT